MLQYKIYIVTDIRALFNKFSSDGLQCSQEMALEGSKCVPMSSITDMLMITVLLSRSSYSRTSQFVPQNNCIHACCK